jgi:hypothetical protein
MGRPEAIRRPLRHGFWAPQPPTGEAFPQTCSTRDCCGHNRLGHARFMEMYPEIAANPLPSWTIHEIIHRCE